MNTIETKQLGLNQLIADLNIGLTWLEKDNNGAGSIQNKYEATEHQITVLKQHPKVKHIQPPKYNFVIVDDTEEELPATQDNPNTIVTEKPTPPATKLVREGEFIQELP